MDDFIRFITEIVDPTVQEFVANPGSVRHAFLACVVTFHSLIIWPLIKHSSEGRVAK